MLIFEFSNKLLLIICCYWASQNEHVCQTNEVKITTSRANGL